MKLLITAIALAMALASAVAGGSARAEDFLYIYLTGVQVVQTRIDGEDPFIVAYVVEENGQVSLPTFVPGENQPWQNVRVGDVIPLNVLIWQGWAQNAMLQAHVYHYDSFGRDFLAGFTSITSAIAGALVAVGTGGAGAAAGAGIAVAGQAASEAVRNSAANYVALGEVHQPLELRRVGTLADQPQYQHVGLWYDFYTEHSWNGAFYGLFWDVRR